MNELLPVCEVHHWTSASKIVTFEVTLQAFVIHVSQHSLKDYKTISKRRMAFLVIYSEETIAP